MLYEQNVRIADYWSRFIRIFFKALPYTTHRRLNYNIIQVTACPATAEIKIDDAESGHTDPRV